MTTTILPQAYLDKQAATERFMSALRTRDYETARELGKRDLDRWAFMGFTYEKSLWPESEGKEKHPQDIRWIIQSHRDQCRDSL